MDAIFISNGDDWEGLYSWPEGELLTQGHSISGREALDALGMNVSYREISFEDHNIGTLPEDFEDLGLEL